MEIDDKLLFKTNLRFNDKKIRKVFICGFENVFLRAVCNNFMNICCQVLALVALKFKLIFTWF